VIQVADTDHLDLAATEGEPTVSKAGPVVEKEAPQPFDPNRQREETRGDLARGLLWLLTFTIGGVLVFIGLGRLDGTVLTQSIFPSLIALAGTALGFYFGSQQAGQTGGPTTPGGEPPGGTQPPANIPPVIIQTPPHPPQPPPPPVIVEQPQPPAPPPAENLNNVPPPPAPPVEPQPPGNIGQGQEVAAEETNEPGTGGADTNEAGTGEAGTGEKAGK
jgi:hypothetical protein